MCKVLEFLWDIWEIRLPFPFLNLSKSGEENKRNYSGDG
jgi:hypothetical protein